MPKARRERRESPPRPKKTARLTCKNCRARKVRCDGGQPICGICIAYNEACQYDRPPPMTQIRAMADKIAQLEQTIKDLQNKDGNSIAPLQASAAVLAENTRVSTLADPLPTIEVADGTLDTARAYYDTTSAVHDPGDTPSQATTGQITVAHSPETRQPLPMETPELRFWEDQAVDSAAVYLSIPQDVIRRLFATHWTWVHANFIAREIGRGSVSQAWLYGGMAFRVAIDIGLFSTSPARSENIIWTQLGRHLAWSCFFWDTTLSLYLGRTPSLPEPPKWDPAMPDDPETEFVRLHTSWPSICWKACQEASECVEQLLQLLDSTFGFQRFTYIMAYCTYTAATVVVQDMKNGRPDTAERFKMFMRALDAITVSCPGIQRSIDILTKGLGTVVEQDQEMSPAVPEQAPQIPAFPYTDFGYIFAEGVDETSHDTTASSNPFFSLDSFPHLRFDEISGSVFDDGQARNSL
ncbi:hypothetical protein FocTR4_00011195 [Fusarium oxysporum f. sp. cubense]|uniref:Zn(2)-C6 fungal-type domain-containing protein n=1 Tax=Fusarium oxysporum f. sp. cubense TaxID=61366 RepID=A0A5C6SDD3_FUSOC|nr:hypothetical protein FocTR4_00011195 [Fusarium oxysporum f. sp. cubense]